VSVAVTDPGQLDVPDMAKLRRPRPATSAASRNVEQRRLLQALATTSRTSTLSTVTPAGAADLTISLALLVAFSDSQTEIDSPLLPFRVQYPATKPGACETAGHDLLVEGDHASPLVVDRHVDHDCMHLGSSIW
jgi:hypothetical protein